MKAWSIPIFLTIISIALGVFAYSNNTPEAILGVGETISGLKRWPGTWSEDTIRVSAGEDLGEPDVTIEINVMRPVFVPNVIRVKQGQVVRIILNGLDGGLADMPGVDEVVGLVEFSGHGFMILGPYDVWITGIRKGVTREVIFRADVVGEFAFECVVFCSPQHYLMTGMLIVEP